MIAGSDLALLAAIISVGFIVESMVGFGSAMISLSLAGLFWPVQRIIPLQVLIGIPVSAYLAIRYRREIAVHSLTRVYLPLALPGLALGILIAGVIPPLALDRLFGALVLVFAALQLVRMAQATSEALPLSPLPRSLALLGAGVMHGLYAVGGPLMVLVASREGFDKGTFRATLSALWLLLGAILAVRFGIAGRYSVSDLGIAALLLIPVALATRFGDWLHTRVSERPFRLVSMGLLILVAGKLSFSRGTP